MKRFKNILAVYDGSVGAEDALDQAMNLARSNKARLTLVDVAETNELSDKSMQERERRLQRTITAVKAESVDNADSRVLVGTRFLEVIRQVLREKHDLVIASAEGGSVVKNVFFGSTGTHLIRKCPCPVWMIKPQQTVPYRHILAAIDPKAENDAADPLSIKIMDFATSLSRMNAAALDIVHAWDVTGNDRDTIASETPAGTVDAILEKHKAVHRDTVDSLTKRYTLSDIEHAVHLPRGRPERIIVDLVQKRGVDLIVMGTVTRTGIPGLLMGNAAETILSAVSCSVLTVKPDSFVTPVTLE